MTIQWTDSLDQVDWDQLSYLYQIAPLGNKSANWLRTAFSNSMFRWLAFSESTVIAAGRAVADGVDCSYLCDIVVHPEYQGLGLGHILIQRLVDSSQGHRKIILYAAPGKESFYARFGFRKMKTAMALFENPTTAAANGIIEE